MAEVRIERGAVAPIVSAGGVAAAPRELLLAEPGTDNGGSDGFVDSGAVFGGGGGAGGNGDDGSGGGDGGDDRTFDASRHAGPDKRNADGSFTRKRGRKSGGGDRAAGKGSRNSRIDPHGIEVALFSLHMMAASAFKASELQLEQKEAEALAKAAANVMQYYPVQIDPKIMAWVQLGVVGAGIYGPRLYLLSARLREEKKDGKTEGASKVAPFPKF